MWSRIIYNADYMPVDDPTSGQADYNNSFINRIAEGLYQDILLIWSLNSGLSTQKTEFRELPEDEKLFWLGYAENVPEKLLASNLYIRPFKDYCRTCIITDQEITIFIRMDHERYCRDISSKGLPDKKNRHDKNDIHPAQSFLQKSIKDQKQFYLELNYLIPLQLKKIGYEIIRQEEAVEIDTSMVRKLARAIHSKYLHEIRTQKSS